MELCLYNAVLTGMSCDGKKFTYVNQLASSDSDLSKRAEWFTCACCPPNMTRTLGFLGGYFWTFSADDEKKAANINVHLFGSTTLRFDVGGQSLELSQTSDFPWHGEVAYSLSGAEAVETSIYIRIPSWASGWTVAPQPTCTTPTKGYLHLPASYLKQNPRFTLHLPMTPRLVSPHPYTNQDVVALARGPIIYCLEDIDNSWVDDHFKSLLFDTSASIEEALETSDSETGEKYMYLRAKGEHSFLDTTALEVRPGLEESAIERRNKGVEELKFIPYYFRANRQGKGHMRVGLRKKR
ncbi:hypothetical protein M8818_002850 [Zalaria obscura]|uniref:Uncharacterized protein n=1 Tax=Zalaria obscura TaxID=2024903 RepID=A0ACC3SH29_9PEZI